MTPGGFEQALEQGAAALGLALDAEQRRKLLGHLALIERWNKVYNLTAVRDPAQMLVQHLLDSLVVVAPLRRHTGGAPAAVLDVGSGAGLPGVTLAIACPELAVSCVDTVAKKATFIRQVGAELALPNLQALHARVETLQPAPWPVITARAFSSLADLVRLTRPLLAPGGVWMAMKGQQPDSEIADLPTGIDVFHVEQLVVPQLDAERCIVWMRETRGQHHVNKKPLITLFASLALAAVAHAAQAPLQSLPAIDVPAYMGTWYQVAWFPNRFQNLCVADTAATYRQLSDGKVEVLNRCRTADGKVDDIVGVATPAGKVDGTKLVPAQLKVSFLPEGLRWIPFARGDYWVIKLADDGRYAVVSEPGRDYLWVLSRQPRLSEADDSAIRVFLTEQGFDLSRLSAHPQREPLR